MTSNIVVFASGAGTNFKAILKSVPVKLLVSDVAKAPAIQIANDHKIPSLVLEKSQIASLTRTSLESLAAGVGVTGSIDWAVLAGFMRILPKAFIESFRHPPITKIVNIHPSLLPAFKGLHGYAQAFEYGAKIAGVTVHLVEHDLDSGPICAQESFSIEGLKSALEVEARGKAIEHTLYPKTLEWLVQEKFRIEKRGDRLSVFPR